MSPTLLMFGGFIAVTLALTGWAARQFQSVRERASEAKFTELSVRAMTGLGAVNLLMDKSAIAIWH